MKKEEIAQKKIEALKMYLQGISKDEIARRLGVSGRSVDKWDYKGNWKELYNKNVQKVTEKVSNSVADEKERSLRLIHGAEAIIAKKIQSGEIQGVNIQGLASLTKAKSELMNPKQNNIFLTGQGNNSLNIEINIPEKVKELLNELNRETRIGVSTSDGE